MMTYDVVIAGSGPAGASAAEALARGGARVLMLEKATLPRYKPCGGGLTVRARAASDAAFAFAPETMATTMYLKDDQRELACPLPAPIAMTMRNELDAFLTERAVAMGATLREGTALMSVEITDQVVRIGVGKEQIKARYLIGADGANGVTAKLSGFAAGREAATAIEVELAVQDRQRLRYADRALLDFTATPGGYAWIFGKADHLSVGVYTTDMRARRELRPRLAAFIAGHPDLRQGRVLLQRGHLVPLAGGRKTRCKGLVLLAGDAAALADPLTGEGISYALASGRRAGMAALAALSGDTAALHAYDRYLEEDLCGDLRYARWVARIAYHFPRFGLRLTEEHPGLRALTASAISGTLEYRTLAGRLVRGAPKLLRYLGG